MNNIPLHTLDWFSFSENPSTRKRMSVYQAIAYLLSKEPGLQTVVREYINEMNQLEEDSAQELLDHYGNDTHPQVEYLSDVWIPESDVADNIDLLNKNRQTVIDYIGGPVSVMFTVLKNEIDGQESNSLSLEPNTDPRYNVDFVTFSQKSLDKWKKIKTIKELGLLDPNAIPGGKVREDAVSNERIATGVLLFLLANQPLMKRQGPKKYIPQKLNKRDDIFNVNFNGIFDLFADQFLNSDSIPDYDKFPSKSTIRKTWEEGWQELLNYRQHLNPEQERNFCKVYQEYQE